MKNKSFKSIYGSLSVEEILTLWSLKISRVFEGPEISGELRSLGFESLLYSQSLC